MSINLYNPATTTTTEVPWYLFDSATTTPETTDLAIYNTKMSTCPPCPPPSSQGPAVPQGILEALYLLVGMLLQYCLFRFRVWAKSRKVGARTDPPSKEVAEDHLYEEMQPQASAPLPPPPTPMGDASVSTVGNPFTNPCVFGPHQG